jgi:ABC-type amino acid transport substrate-binding protein
MRALISFPTYCVRYLCFVDQCKAIAAAIFGNGTTHQTVSRIRVNPSNRFVMLQNGTVDVLVTSTTHTMERQVFEVR